MATALVNSSLDVGPESCILLDLALNKTLKINVDTLLPYAAEEDPLVEKLFTLLRDYQEIKNQKPNLHLQLIPFHVARWVHHTNKLEFAGYSDEGETREILLSRKVAENVKEREVLQTL